VERVHIERSLGSVGVQYRTGGMPMRHRMVIEAQVDMGVRDIPPEEPAEWLHTVI